MVKELIIHSPKENIRVKDLKLFPITKVKRETRLYDLLKIMRELKSHICLIGEENQPPTGICTMEDVLEELLQSSIIDEFDENSNDPGKKILLARAIETLGLEESSFGGGSNRYSLDLMLKRRNDHPLTSELHRMSLDIKSHDNPLIKNPVTGRVSLDLSGQVISKHGKSKVVKDNKKGKKDKYYKLKDDTSIELDDEFFFSKDN